jgi:hypothetical protein
MTIEYTYDLTASATASATEVMQNFSDIATAVDLIGGDQIDPENGIDKGGISDRFTTFSEHIMVVPFSQTAAWGTSQISAILEGTPGRIAGTRICLGTGQRASLVKIDYRAAAVTDTTGDYPTMTIYKNTNIVIGESVVLDTAATWLELQVAADAVANPLIQLAHEDTIDIYLGAENAIDTATVRGLEVILHFKVELTS